MRILPVLLLVLALCACEKKPTEEEIAEQKRVEEAARKAAMTPVPGDWMKMKSYQSPLDKNATPKPGDWMKMRDYKSPLDQKPKH